MNKDNFIGEWDYNCSMVSYDEAYHIEITFKGGAKLNADHYQFKGDKIQFFLNGYAITPYQNLENVYKFVLIKEDRERWGE